MGIGARTGDLYKPLDKLKFEIRVLKINPSANKNDKVQCTLTTASLLSNPDFNALSYVWGNANDTEHIDVNGISFSATKNLVEFLRQLRDLQAHYKPKTKERSFFKRFYNSQEEAKESPTWPTEHIPLWVDAICINQSDSKELSNQVSMMRDIYQRAKLTYAWLGTEENDSDLAMNALSASAEELFNPTDISKKPWLREKYSFLGKDDAPVMEEFIPNKSWLAVRQIVRRSYWKRVWTLQEIVLPENVWICCGPAGCSLQSALELSNMIANFPADQQPQNMDLRLWQKLKEFSQNAIGFQYLDRISRMRSQLRHTNSVRSFEASWKAFLNTRDLEATDPRDSIYGLLGVLDLGVQPKYWKSTRNVFTDVARVAIGRGYLQDVLCRSGLYYTASSGRKIWRLRSWVPEWSNLSSENHIKVQSIYNAGGSVLHESQAPFITDIGDLKLSGILSQETAKVGVGLTDKTLPSEIRNILNEWDIGATYITGIPILQAILRLITLDRDPSTGSRLRAGDHRLQVVFCGVLNYMLLLSSTGVTEGNELRQNIQQSLSELGLALGEDFGARFQKTILGDTEDGGNMFEGKYGKELIRPDISLQYALVQNFARVDFLKFFYTKDSYLGIGSPFMLPGDFVCILPGCELPIVLRREKSYYIHLGTCFVLGLMDGEGMVDAENRPRPLEIFEIH